MSEQSASPGWYPTNDGRQGYWDGDQWTEFRVPQGGGPGVLKGKATDAAARLTSKELDLPPDTIWSAIGKPMTGIGAGRYRMDERHLYFERGTLRTDSQQVPIENVMDVDVKQSMAQKARSLFTVLVHIQRANGMMELVTMDDISGGREAQRIINEAAHQARARMQRARNTMTYQGANPAPVVQSAPSPGPAASSPHSQDPMEQLTQLGKLHEAEVLTDEEFAAKKAEILSRM